MDRAGQPFESPMKGFSPGRGDRPVARSARRILRKPVEASRKRASPADAFCAEDPCPRATNQASWKYQTLSRDQGLKTREVFRAGPSPLETKSARSGIPTLICSGFLASSPVIRDTDLTPSSSSTTPTR